MKTLLKMVFLFSVVLDLLVLLFVNTFWLKLLAVICLGLTGIYVRWEKA